MCTHVRQNFWKVSSNSEHHSKPTMNINSQHHNLLGNKISPKSEDFCIWRPFCTLVTMATAAILNFLNRPKAATHYSGYSYKVPWSLMKGIQKKIFVSMATAAKFVQSIPIVLAYLVALDVDVVPIKFHQFLFGE